MSEEKTDKLVQFLAREREVTVRGLERGAAPPEHAGEWPDENTWAALEAGLLSPGERDRLLAHTRTSSAARRRMVAIIREWDDDISIPATPTSDRRAVLFRLGPRVYALAACLVAAVTVSVVYYRLSHPGIDKVLGSPMVRLTESSGIGIIHRRTLSAPETVANRDQIEALIAKLTTRTQKHPDDAESWYGLGQAQARLTHYDDARRAYERALEIKPDRADVRNSLGLMLYLTKDYEAAADEFTRAIALDETQPGYRLNLAMTLEELQRPDEAADQWQQFIELAPDDPEADEVRRWLAIVRPAE